MSLWVFRVRKQDRETSRQFEEQEGKQSSIEKEDERGCWGVSRGLSAHISAVSAADSTASPASSISSILNVFPTQRLPEEWGG